MNSKCEQMLKDTGNKRTKKNADDDSSGRPELFCFHFLPNLFGGVSFDGSAIKQQNFDEIQTATMFSTNGNNTRLWSVNFDQNCIDITATCTLFVTYPPNFPASPLFAACPSSVGR